MLLLILKYFFHFCQLLTKDGLSSLFRVKCFTSCVAVPTDSYSLQVTKAICKQIYSETKRKQTRNMDGFPKSFFSFKRHTQLIRNYFSILPALNLKTVSVLYIKQQFILIEKVATCKEININIFSAM